MRARSLEEEAHDPRTPPHRLRELAGRSASLARLVAANPAIDAQLLFELGEHFPREMLANPLLPLLLLEAPDLPVRLGAATMLAVLALPEVPESFLEWGAVHPDATVRLVVANHSRASRGTLARLASGEEPAATAARLHIALAGELSAESWRATSREATAALALGERAEGIRALVELGVLGEGTVEHLGRAARCAAAGARRASPGMLTRLAHDRCPAVRRAVAAHPATRPPVLVRLAEDHDRETRAQVAANRGTPVEVLAVLWQSGDPVIALALAENPALPRTIVESLAASPRAEVRRRIAEHPAANGALLAWMLRREEDLSVCARLAAHPALPLRWLQWFVDCDDRRLRRAVAANPALPTHLLAQLLRDTDRHVRTAAASHPTVDGAQLRRLARDPDLHQIVAAHPHTPPALLESFASDYNARLRALVATNPASPVPLLERLATPCDPAVDHGLAQNPALRAPLLALLAERSDRRVHVAVAAHPRTPRPALEHLAGNDDDEVRRTILENLLRRPGDEPWVRSLALSLVASLSDEGSPTFARFLALLIEETPEAALGAAARSLHWSDRLAVAQNPATATAVLVALSDDCNCVVRAAAREASLPHGARNRRHA